MHSTNEHTLRTTTALINSGEPASPVELLGDVEVIQEFIKEWTVTEVEPPTPADIRPLHVLRRRLRPVFIAPSTEQKLAIVNDLLAGAPIQPRVVKHDDLGTHIHYFPLQASLSDHLTADCAMALAELLAEDGGDRLRVCQADDCARVFVDFSRNKSKLYCDSKRCGNRVNAASYRARLRT